MKLLKAKIDNIKFYMDENGLNDPHLLGLVLLAVVGMSVLWKGVGVVQRNYTLQQKVVVIEEGNNILELQNSNRQLQNEYYKTPEFAELKARRVNGRAAPGERVYIIDDEVALSSLKYEELPDDETVPLKEKPEYQQNFEAWMSFFFGS